MVELAPRDRWSIQLGAILLIDRSFIADSGSPRCVSWGTNAINFCGSCLHTGLVPGIGLQKRASRVYAQTAYGFQEQNTLDHRGARHYPAWFQSPCYCSTTRRSSTASRQPPGSGAAALDRSPHFHDARRRNGHSGSPETAARGYLLTADAWQGPALSKRERGVVQLIAEAPMNEQIATVFTISLRTVGGPVMAKLDLSSSVAEA